MLKWEIGVLLDNYSKRINGIDEYSKEFEMTQDLYTQAIILNVKEGFGLFYPIDDFIDEVKHGSIIDYDGIGYLLNKDGNRLKVVKCNSEWLEHQKPQAVFVAWYNK